MLFSVQVSTRDQLPLKVINENYLLNKLVLLYFLLSGFRSIKLHKKNTTTMFLQLLNNKTSPANFS